MEDEYSPLKGKKILVTRSKEQSGQLSRLIKRYGGTPIEIPLLHFQQPDDETVIKDKLSRFTDYRWIVFTSANGVRFFHDLKQQFASDTPYPKVAVVGTKTTKAARDMGIEVDLVPDEFVAESLAESLLGVVEPGEKILLARGNLSRSHLVEKLMEEGHDVTDLVVYDTKRNDAARGDLIEAMKHGSVDIITFTSPSTVTYFVELLKTHGLPDMNKYLIACIGPVAAKTAARHGLTPQIVPDEYTAEGLVEAIITYLNKHNGSREEVR